MRRQNSQIRNERASRNYQTKLMGRITASIQRHRRDGEIKRGEGRGNTPYGPRPGARPSILAVHAHGARGNKPYPTPNHDAIERPVREVLRATYETLGRDRLRALAKEAGVKGWGKMTKAQMIEGILQ